MRSAVALLCAFAALAAATPGKTAWTFPGSESIESRPAVYQGADNTTTVFIGSYDDFLYGVNGNTGKSAIKRVMMNDMLRSSPAVVPVGSRTLVVELSGDANVYAVDAATGAVAWKTPSGGDAGVYASSSPAAWVQSATAALVFVGSTSGALLALDAASGAVVWTVQLAPAIYGSPTVHTVNATLTVVVVGADDGQVYAVDAAAGTVLWQFSTAAFVRGGASVFADAQGRGYVLVGSNDGNVYCLHLLTGALAWAYQTNGDVYSTPVVHAVGGAPYIFVGSYDKNVYCLNMTGGLVWQYTTGDYVIASPLVVTLGAAATVYIGGEDTFFYALDAATGKLQWRKGALDPVWSTAALVPSATHGPLAVFGTQGGNLFAFTMQ